MEIENTEVEETIVELEDYELFESAIDNFILEIESLAESLPLIVSLLAMRLRGTGSKINKFVSTNTEADESGKPVFKIPVDQFNFFNRLTTDRNIAEAAMTILPRHFIVSLVSQYDAYLADLYRALFATKQELAFSLEKEFTFQEILKFKDLDELKEEVIEKDVENLLRESHFEQLKVLERKITKFTGKEFTLTTNLSILPTFIEVAERRNLFVHCNGIVSKQYIEVCKKHKVDHINEVKINDELDVEPTYFDKAYKAYYEMGVKLSQVLWRKFLPDKLIEADKNLNNICYDLIYNGYYDLAKVLLKFGTEELHKNGSQEMRKTLVINKALAYYLSGDKTTSTKILDAEDFTLGNEFKLAVAVLKDNYEEAKRMMLKIGNQDEILDKETYQEWPLFKTFRDTAIFKETFKELFGEDFIIREAPEKSFKTLLDIIKDKKKDATDKK